MSLHHDHEHAIRRSDEVGHLVELLKEFSTLMLGTFEQTGDAPSLRARPMSVARLEPDGTLYFITRAPAQKVDEAATTQRCHVFGQSRTRFLSIQGEVRVSTDRAKLRELWSKAYEVWLDGPDDPQATLLIVTPREAELWDVSGANGLRFLFESARALATGSKAPAYSDDMHERVTVR